MGRKSNNFEISKMYCCCCGKEGISIPRKSGHYREAGHLKKIYCINCKRVWNHAEVRSIYNDYNYKDFQLEMKYQNFNEEGERKKPYRIFRGELKQRGLYNG